MLLALSAVTGSAAGLQTSLLARSRPTVLHRVRVDAVLGLLRQPLGEFERRSRGDLVARVTSDVDKLGHVVSEAIPFAVGDVVALAAALFGLFLVSPLIALLSLLVIPPMAIAGRWLQRRAAVVYPAERAAAGAATGEFTESIEGLETIRTFGCQARRHESLRAANRHAVATTQVGMHMRNRFSIAVTTSQAFVTATITIVVATLAADATISVGAASAGLLALGGVYAPLASLLEWVDEIQSAGAALDRVVALATPATATPPPSARRATSRPPCGDRVRARVVLVPSRATRCCVTCRSRSPPASGWALVGETGAGKSTIARLIAGLARPDRGTVTLAGDRPPTLAVQEGFVLHDTVAANLRLVVPSASDATMTAAFEAMGVSDWFGRLSSGLSTPAVELSDGGAPTRQRRPHRAARPGGRRARRGHQRARRHDRATGRRGTRPHAGRPHGRGDRPPRQHRRALRSGAARARRTPDGRATDPGVAETEVADPSVTVPENLY